MTSSNDIKQLFSKFGGRADLYQEISRENAARDSQARWPLLSAISSVTATPPPSVKASPFQRGREPAPAQPPAPPKPAIAPSPVAPTAPAQAPQPASASLAAVPPRKPVFPGPGQQEIAPSARPEPLPAHSAAPLQDMFNRLRAPAVADTHVAEPATAPGPEPTHEVPSLFRRLAQR